MPGGYVEYVQCNDEQECANCQLVNRRLEIRDWDR